MANPLRIKTSSGLPNTTNFTGLQEFSNAELEYVIDKVFTRHAQANNRPGVLGFDSANGASIGSFINTRRTESVGDHPAAGTRRRLHRRVKVAVTVIRGTSTRSMPVVHHTVAHLANISLMVTERGEFRESWPSLHLVLAWWLR